MIKEVYSEKETRDFAYEMAQKAEVGQVYCLDGDLGVGKTVFTKGFAEGLGIDDDITSPTFTIVNEYNTKNTNIYHFDLYRLSDIDEFYAIGGEEYLSNGICIFEWGEMLEDVLKNNYTKITFKKSSSEDDYREILVEEF